MQPTATPDAPTRKRDVAPKKPTKFLADLTRAMQAAAESSRASTLEQFQAEAKAHVEQVHARSADEAAELRKAADDDIVDIRDWSKAELARIREETEKKISQRKSDLDYELEEHAARIEREIERVQAPRRGLRSRDGQVLRATPDRGRSCRVRRDGREPARSLRRSTSTPTTTGTCRPPIRPKRP